ncbi:MAG: DUF1800 domain-containing protein [Planctomycetota bacterium]
MNLEMIDPAWAWQPFEPDAGNPWDTAAAAHLFRRAGFGANRKQIDAALQRSPADVVADLVAGSEPADYRKQLDALIRAGLASGSVSQLAAQWVYRMVSTPAPLLEKTTLFWHGHFATSAEKVEEADLMQRQNDLLRQHALGDFAALVQGISRDAAMLIYLDSATNRKAHPNENYAREIMELFCLGEGNYTETDIRELARCFTGWEIKRNKFRFNRYQHDFGKKSFLDSSGEFSGEQGVEIVLAQDAVPRFIASKLIRYFVADEPAPTKALIEPLAKELRDNELHVAPTLQRILGSNLFFTHARARKIKSPIDVAVGLLRGLEGSTNNYEIAGGCRKLGLGLYFPPSVKGWDGGRTWINSSTLLGRANLIRQVLDSDKTRFGRKSLAEYLESQDVQTTEQLVEWIEPLLFAVPISPDAKRQVAALDSTGANRDKSLKDALHVLCSLPEFQLA